ncbi:hypothetical protein D3C81_757220 [compost metagenome]
MKVSKGTSLSIISTSLLFFINEMALLSIIASALYLKFKKKPFECLLVICFYLTFQWTWSAISANTGVSNLEPAHVKTIAGSIFLAIILTKYLSKPAKFQILCIVGILLLLMKGTFFAANKMVAIKYLINMYIPMIITIISMGNISFSKNREKISSKIETYIALILIGSLIGALAHVVSGYDTLISLTSSLADNRQDTDSIMQEIDGEFKYFTAGAATKIAGIPVIRNPGLIIDSILAGYTLAFIIVYIIYFVRRNKAVLLGASCFLLFITFSKGAWAIPIITIFITEINKFLWKKSVKLRLITNILLISVISLSTIVSASRGTGDSSFIHFMGLSQVFVFHPSIAGNDLGSGGNYADSEFTEKLKTGAESTIGVIYYHTGAAGLALLIALNASILMSLLKKNDRKHSVLIGMLAAQLILSFLQENTYNLAYSFPRILIFIAIIFEINRTNTHANQKNNPLSHNGTGCRINLPINTIT